jgi:hypothetical protein
MPALAGADSTFEIPVGESVDLDGGLTLSFERVPGDSRCPIGVQCVWAGDGVAALRLRSVGWEGVQFDLHTHPDFKRQTTIAGLTFRLETLAPYPVYNVPHDPADYVATVSVSTASQVTPVEESTWGRIKALYAE